MLRLCLQHYIYTHTHARAHTHANMHIYIYDFANKIPINVNRSIRTYIKFVHILKRVYNALLCINYTDEAKKLHASYIFISVVN